MPNQRVNGLIVVVSVVVVVEVAFGAAVVAEAAVVFAVVVIVVAEEVEGVVVAEAAVVSARMSGTDQLRNFKGKLPLSMIPIDSNEYDAMHLILMIGFNSNMFCESYD